MCRFPSVGLGCSDLSTSKRNTTRMHALDAFRRNDILCRLNFPRDGVDTKAEPKACLSKQAWFDPAVSFEVACLAIYERRSFAIVLLSELLEQRTRQLAFYQSSECSHAISGCSQLSNELQPRLQLMTSTQNSDAPNGRARLGGTV